MVLSEKEKHQKQDKLSGKSGNKCFYLELSRLKQVHIYEREIKNAIGEYDLCFKIEFSNIGIEH